MGNAGSKNTDGLQLLRFYQFILGKFLLGNIAADTDKRHRTVLVYYPGTVGGVPEPCPVFMQHAVLDPTLFFTFFQYSCKKGLASRHIVGMNNR